MKISTNLIESILKTAAFPAMFLELKPDQRSYISRAYDVGPDSETKEISIDQVSKKPYSEQLLVYTQFTMSESDQDAADRELEEGIREFEKNPEYQELRGSTAGSKMHVAKEEELKKIIESKYKAKEHVVAWGIGTRFNVNQDMFKYRYHGRGRSYSNAPENRKSLIEYMKTNGGKVYVITPDPKLNAIRQERRKNKVDVSDIVKNTLVSRAKSYAQIKKKQMIPLVDGYINEQKQVIVKNLDNLIDKIKNGELYSESDIAKYVLNGISYKTIGNLGHMFWQMNSYMNYIDSKDSLFRFMNEINDLIEKITGKKQEPINKVIERANQI